MKNFERRAKINRLNKNTTNNKTSETWRVFCCCCCCFHWRIQALTHFGDCKHTEVISSSRSGSSENSRPPRGWSLSEFGLVFSRQGTTPEREEWDCNKMKTVIRQILTIANVLFFWGVTTNYLGAAFQHIYWFPDDLFLGEMTSTIVILAAGEYVSKHCCTWSNNFCLCWLCNFIQWS